MEEEAEKEAERFKDLIEEEKNSPAGVRGSTDDEFISTDDGLHQFLHLNFFSKAADGIEGAIPTWKIKQVLDTLAIGDGMRTPFAFFPGFGGWAGKAPRWLAILFEITCIWIREWLYSMLLFYVEMISVAFDLVLVMTSLKYLGEIAFSVAPGAVSFDIVNPIDLMFSSFPGLLPWYPLTIDWFDVVFFDWVFPALQWVLNFAIEIPFLFLRIPVLARCQGVYGIFSLALYVLSLVIVTWAVEKDWMLRLKLYPAWRKFAASMVPRKQTAEPATPEDGSVDSVPDAIYASTRSEQPPATVESFSPPSTPPPSPPSPSALPAADHGAGAIAEGSALSRHPSRLVRARAANAASRPPALQPVTSGLSTTSDEDNMLEADDSATSQGKVIKAVDDNNEEDVKFFLDEGGDVDLTSFIAQPTGTGEQLTGIPLLMRAACKGHIRLVEMLLKKGADVDLQASDGTTALMGAVIATRKGGCLEENHEVLRALLDADAYVELRDVHGCTALQYARALECPPEVIGMLHKHSHAASMQCISRARSGKEWNHLRARIFEPSDTRRGRVGKYVNRYSGKFGKLLIAQGLMGSADAKEAELLRQDLARAAALALKHVDSMEKALQGVFKPLTFLFYETGSVLWNSRFPKLKRYILDKVVGPKIVALLYPINGPRGLKWKEVGKEHRQGVPKLAMALKKKLESKEPLEFKDRLELEELMVSGLAWKSVGKGELSGSLISSSSIEKALQSIIKLRTKQHKPRHAPIMFPPDEFQDLKLEADFDLPSNGYIRVDDDTYFVPVQEKTLRPDSYIRVGTKSFRPARNALQPIGLKWEERVHPAGRQLKTPPDSGELKLAEELLKKANEPQQRKSAASRENVGCFGQCFPTHADEPTSTKNVLTFDAAEFKSLQLEEPLREDHFIKIPDEAAEERYFELARVKWVDVRSTLEGCSEQDVQNLVEDPEAFVLGLLTKMARPMIEASLPEPLTWEDIRPVIEQIDSLDEIMQAVHDPEGFLERLAGASKPTVYRAAIRYVIVKNKASIMQLLGRKSSLTWEDVLPVLELIDTFEEAQEAVRDPESFLERLVDEVGPAGVRYAVALARPAIETHLAPLKIKWEDVRPAIELIDSVEELKKAVVDPEAFLEDLLDIAGPAVFRFAVAKARPVLEPKLQPLNMKWDDVKPAIELIDSVEELKDAMNDPEAFLEHFLYEAAGPIAVRFAIAAARPTIERHLPAPLVWADVLPALQLIDSVEKVRSAVQEPETFIKGMLEKTGDMAIRFAISKARPTIESHLPEALEWEDIVQPVLDELDSVAKVKQAVADPEAFLERLLEQAVGPAAIRLAVSKARPKIQQYLRPLNIRWSDVRPALEMIDTLEELKAAATDPEAFLNRLLDNAIGPVAIKLALAMARPPIEEVLRPLRVTWADVQPAVELVDSVQELKLAAKSPGVFVERLLDDAIGPAAIRMAIALARPALESHLSPLGVKWNDVRPALELMDSAKELKDAAADPATFLKKLTEKAVGPVAIRFAIAAARPEIETHLPAPLVWADVLPALQLIDSVEKVRSAVQEPETFIKGMLEKTGDMAIRFAISKARPTIEIHLPDGLKWEDIVQPALNELGSVADVEEAAADPKAFLERLLRAAGPAAVRLAISKARPKIQQYLRPLNVRWADVRPVLEKLATAAGSNGVLSKALATLQKGQATPEALQPILELMRDQAEGPVAIRLALAIARPKLEERLHSLDLAWEDVRVRVEQTSSVKQLKKAARHPGPFLRALFAEVSGPAAKRYITSEVISEARPKIEAQLEELKQLKQLELRWEDVRPALEQIDPAFVQDEVRAACTNFEGFLKGYLLDNEPDLEDVPPVYSGPSVADLKRDIAEAVEAEDYARAAKLKENVAEAEKAESSPQEPFVAARPPFGRHFRSAAKRLAIAKARPKIEKLLQQEERLKGVKWEDILSALQQIDDVKSLTRDPDKLLRALHDKILEDSSLRPAVLPYAIALSRPTIEPLLMGLNVTWEDLRAEFLARIESVEVLDAFKQVLVSCNEPARFLPPRFAPKTLMLPSPPQGLPRADGHMEHDFAELQLGKWQGRSGRDLSVAWRQDDKLGGRYATPPTSPEGSEGTRAAQYTKPPELVLRHLLGMLLGKTVGKNKTRYAVVLAGREVQRHITMVRRDSDVRWEDVRRAIELVEWEEVRYAAKLVDSVNELKSDAVAGFISAGKSEHLRSERNEEFLDSMRYVVGLRWKQVEIAKVSSDRYFVQASSTTTLGSKWKEIGHEKPKEGNEITNQALSKTLFEKQEFTEVEVKAFKLEGLKPDSFIKVSVRDARNKDKEIQNTQLSMKLVEKLEFSRDELFELRLPPLRSDCYIRSDREDQEVHFQPIDQPSAAALQFEIAHARRKIEGHLKKFRGDLKWDDVRPALEELNTVQEIRDASVDPGRFFRGRAKGPAALQYAIAAARPKLQVQLRLWRDQRDGRPLIQWAELLPILTLFEKDDLHKAAVDPKEFVEKLEGSGIEGSGKLEGPAHQAALRFTMLAIRPAIEPQMQIDSLEWDDVRLAVDLAADQIELAELRELSSDDKPLDKLKQRLDKSGGLGARWLKLAEARKQIAAILPGELHWTDVRHSFLLIRSDDKFASALKAAVDKHSKFFEQLLSEPTEDHLRPLAKRLKELKRSAKGPEVSVNRQEEDDLWVPDAGVGRAALHDVISFLSEDVYAFVEAPVHVRCCGIKLGWLSELLKQLRIAMRKLLQFACIDLPKFLLNAFFRRQTRRLNETGSSLVRALERSWPIMSDRLYELGFKALQLLVLLQAQHATSLFLLMRYTDWTEYPLLFEVFKHFSWSTFRQPTVCGRNYDANGTLAKDEVLIEVNDDMAVTLFLLWTFCLAWPLYFLYFPSLFSRRRANAASSTTLWEIARKLVRLTVIAPLQLVLDFLTSVLLNLPLVPFLIRLSRCTESNWYRKVCKAAEEGKYSVPGDSRALGSKWKAVGGDEPKEGNEITNEALSKALLERLAFTQAETKRFNLQNLKTDSFIKVTVAGSKWKVGDDKPKKGNEITNEALSKALLEKHEFNRAEIERFKLNDLKFDSFIKVGNKYFEQAEGEVRYFEQAAREWHLPGLEPQQACWPIHASSEMLHLPTRLTFEHLAEQVKHLRELNSELGFGYADSLTTWWAIAGYRLLVFAELADRILPLGLHDLGGALLLVFLESSLLGLGQLYSTTRRFALLTCGVWTQDLLEEFKIFDRAADVHRRERNGLSGRWIGGAVEHKGRRRMRSHLETSTCPYMHS